LAILSFLAQSASAQGKTGDAEQTLLQSANRERATQGLAPLKWSDTLAEAARQHALQMAEQNTLSHQLPGEPALADRASRAGARFSTIAENVAEGPSAQSIHQQWMNSPQHRANLLDPQLDSVGIAVADRNGTLFAVGDFSLAIGSMSIREQEKLVEAQLQKRGLRLLDYADDGRRSCVLDNGHAGSHQPSFVLHYATPDLQNLPDILEQRIQSGKYHSAVVGACPSNAKIGLSTYRVAVLLFE
jgi:Cysteine-rich secretory protein family